MKKTFRKLLKESEKFNKDGIYVGVITKPFEKPIIGLSWGGKARKLSKESTNFAKKILEAAKFANKMNEIIIKSKIQKEDELYAKGWI